MGCELGDESEVCGVQSVVSDVYCVMCSILFRYDFQYLSKTLGSLANKIVQTFMRHTFSSLKFRSI